MYLHFIILDLIDVFYRFQDVKREDNCICHDRFEGRIFAVALYQ